jgi:maltokinase
VAEALLARIAGTAPTDDLLIERFPPLAALAGERGFDVDQTNDLVVVGDLAVVKWFLHPTEDPQPAPQRMATLARAGFDGTPRPWATVRLDTGTSTALVATVVDCIPRTRDGWEWAVDEVRAHARGHGSVDGTGALPFVGEVARLVARMHVALATAGVGTATHADMEQVRREALDDLDHTALEPDDRDAAGAILGRILDCAGTPVIDVHGDLHIGQVLRSDVDGRYYVIDFDGNPTLSPAARMAQQPAARDVAGMLASLDHVGRVVLHRTEDLDDAERARVLDWIEDAQEAFLDDYLRCLAEHGRSDLLDLRLVRPLQLQQECREYAYAARYLPHWRYVPDAALPALLRRGHG